MTTQELADWCEDMGEITICGTDMELRSRDSLGIKWCFTCRTRHEFWWAVYSPRGLSYYGPSADMEGVAHGCTDLFPGWVREAPDY